jgi:predicted MFS family arabinose efflux permease
VSGALSRRGGAKKAPIWTAGYVTLVGAVLFTYLNHMALLPIIPLFVTEYGGTEFFAGVVLASFSVASFVLRPRIGRIVDAWDAGSVLFVGCVVLAASTAGMLLPVLWFMLLANAVRGVGWAAINTGSHVVLARLAPSERRGEASGYFTLFQSLAAASGPPLALYWLGRTGSFNGVFLACGVSAAAAAVLSTSVRQAGGRLVSVLGSHRGRWSLQETIPPSTRLPAALIVLLMVSQPAVLGFVPLYADRIGVSSRAVMVFYVVSGIAALLGRSLLGRLSDIYSRGVSVLWGFVLIGGGLATLVVTTSATVLIVLGAVYSLGQGMAIPAMTALAIERSDRTRVGVAMAAYSAAFQVALGIGGILAGALIGLVGYKGLYGVMTCLAGLGMTVALWHWSELRRA